MRKLLVIVLTLALIAVSTVLLVAAKKPAKSAVNDPRLKSAYRFQRGGWIYVHLEGAPEVIGFQHGYLLAPQIADALKFRQANDTHASGRDWAFLRKTAQEVYWPKIEDEYQRELTGIAEGLKAAGVQADIWDVVALNAMEETIDYYVPWLNKQQAGGPAKSLAPGNCSAFVATGSWTKDHQPVIAHNNWTSYMSGERWVIVYDILPQNGNRILMDGFPGVIASDDDFGINAGGLMVTETTITQFFGFDPKGIPEFVRARKALQYATTIDEYVQIMLEGNNGGYANDWLLADRSGEVARFELGLKHHKLWRTKDGYFVGSNFASDPELIKDETTGFDSNDLSTSPNARRVRWEELMQHYKGQIDVKMAQKFLGDHWDSFQKKEEPNERALCGHVDISPRGIKEWDWQPFYPGGAVQGKATDATLAKSMSLWAHTGHPCGQDFKAKSYLDQHPEFAWQKGILRDMSSGPWSLFRSGEQRPTLGAKQ
jgi:hypothetical protein